MHLKRWITGLIGFPLIAFLIYKGGTWFTGLISGVCLISLCEYFRIVFNPKGKTVSGFILLLGLVLSLGVIWAAHIRSTELILVAMALNLILAALFSLTQFKTDSFILENLTKQIQAMAYIPLFLSFLVMIRNQTDGMVWIFMLVCIIFAGDIGAFYAGRNLGRHKLCPSVSPGKTVEGSVGGLAANLLMGGFFIMFFLPSLNWGIGILLFLCLGAAGQIGDLFESEFKRFSGVKDSGTILPGHGGLLDRIDALLFAAPVAFLFKEYLI